MAALNMALIYARDCPMETGASWLSRCAVRVTTTYQENGFRVYRARFGLCEEDVVLRQIDDSPLLEISTGTACAPWKDDRGLAERFFADTGKATTFSPRRYLGPGILVRIDSAGWHLTDVDEGVDLPDEIAPDELVPTPHAP